VQVVEVVWWIFRQYIEFNSSFELGCYCWNGYGQAEGIASD
jgi:hypothetical protein